jgi:phospholipid transport system substrate-binding protein
MRLIGWLSACFFLLAGTPASAQTDARQADSPTALVQGVTDEVLSILREDKALQGGDRKRAIELIETRIAPHFDFSRMTSLAVGRAWQQADDAQREALTKEFRTLLVRTYSNALTSYKDQTVTFKPARGGGNDDEASVHSQINQPGAAPVPLDYRLWRRDGEWKVYDVVVNNVSLVTSYRGSFASELDSGGIEGLLKALQSKNRNPGTAATS